jgi:hypothetical protein
MNVGWPAIQSWMCNRSRGQAGRQPDESLLNDPPSCRSRLRHPMVPVSPLSHGMIEHSGPCKLPSLESPQSGTSLQRGDRATLRTLNAYRLAGVYAACILNGEKPGELPAQQAMKECGASRREHV